MLGGGGGNNRHNGVEYWTWTIVLSLVGIGDPHNYDWKCVQMVVDIGKEEFPWQL